MKNFLLILFIAAFSCQTRNKYPDGGYDYPMNVSNSDTNLYYYPLKEIEPKRDAFQDAYAYLFFQAFDEPNLSLTPQSKDVFRLTYSTDFGNSAVISLSENLIIVKQGNPGSVYNEDTSRLSEIEKLYLNLLKRRFPIDTSGKSPFVKHYLDSMTKLYPQLLDPTYYHKLYKKTIVRNTEKFTYRLNKINLTQEQYDTVIQQINSSGFWTLPYKVECKDVPMDAGGFTLEANTAKKYKIVRATSCTDDTTKFAKACQRLIEFAKMDKEIHLVWKGTVVIADSIDLPQVHYSK